MLRIPCREHISKNEVLRKMEPKRGILHPGKHNEESGFGKLNTRRTLKAKETKKNSN